MSTLYEKQESALSNRGSIFTTYWRFQSFTVQAGQTHVIASVSLNLLRTLSPGTFFVRIYGISATKPNIAGGILSSGSYDGDLVSGSSNEWISIPMSSYTLEAGTQYAIVWGLENSGFDSSNALSGYGTSTNSYATGINGRSTNSGSSWTTYTGDDFAFREYGDEPPITKTFTADVSISKDDVTKTFTADANLVEPKKTFTVDASLWEEQTKTLTADVHIDIDRDISWPVARAQAYDEDKVWDEENKSWYSPTSSIGVERMAQGGGRYRQQIVVLSDEGFIYFGAF